MKKKVFPIEEIKEKIKKGYTITQLAEIYQTSRLTMSKFLKENQIETLGNKKRAALQLLNEAEVAQKYLNGATIRELEAEYNCSNSVIHRCLINQNVSIRTNSEVHQKWVLNETYFDNIDSLDKAYLLGFIAADGWVTDRNEVGIGLQAQDIDMIIFFQSQLQTNKPIYQRDENTVELRVQNQHMADTLKSYSIVPRKSLLVNIGEIIQLSGLIDEQIPAFLLGYFDGDGGIYKSNGQFSCSITGTWETCQYFFNYFDKIGLITKRHKDTKNNYTYQIGGRNQVKKALSKLYNISSKLTFFYQRKYNIFVEL